MSVRWNILKLVKEEGDEEDDGSDSVCATATSLLIEVESLNMTTHS